jgi:broad specificity phosphatase PhoE
MGLPADTHEANSNRFFAVVRHADRADDMGALVEGTSWALSQESWQWPLDPPLSDIGVANAQQLGRDLALAAKSQGSHVHTVITSPYLRCIQTAAEICRQLHYKCNFLIDISLGEIFGPTVMGDIEPTNPVRPFDEIIQAYKLEGLDIQCKPQGRLPHWPESLGDARERFTNRFIQHLTCNEVLNQNFIIVSHGDCVGAALSCMRSSQKWLAAQTITPGGYFLASRTVGDRCSLQSLQTSPSSINDSLEPTNNVEFNMSEEPQYPSLWPHIDWKLELHGIETRTRTSGLLLSDRWSATTVKGSKAGCQKLLKLVSVSMSTFAKLSAASMEYYDGLHTPKIVKCTKELDKKPVHQHNQHNLLEGNMEDLEQMACMMKQKLINLSLPDEVKRRFSKDSFD